MKTPIVPTVTDELIARLEAAADYAANQVIRSHGWEGTVDEFADGMLGADERYMRWAEPATILALLAHIADLKQQITAASVDAERLNSIEENCWDVRYSSQPNADAGDGNISIEIVGHFMGQPFERVVGENYSENLRAAIDQAMTADAYPPARPEYDEPDDIPGD